MSQHRCSMPHRVILQVLQFSMTSSQHRYLSIVRIEKLVAVILSHVAYAVERQLRVVLLLQRHQLGSSCNHSALDLPALHLADHNSLPSDVMEHRLAKPPPCTAARAAGQVQALCMQTVRSAHQSGAAAHTLTHLIKLLPTHANHWQLLHHVQPYLSAPDAACQPLGAPCKPHLAQPVQALFVDPLLLNRGGLLELLLPPHLRFCLTCRCLLLCPPLCLLRFLPAGGLGRLFGLLKVLCLSCLHSGTCMLSAHTSLPLC